MRCRCVCKSVIPAHVYLFKACTVCARVKCWRFPLSRSCDTSNVHVCVGAPKPAVCHVLVAQINARACARHTPDMFQPSNNTAVTNDTSVPCQNGMI